MCMLGQHDTGCMTFSTCACFAQCEVHGWPSYEMRMCLNASSTTMADAVTIPVVYYTSATQILPGMNGVEPSPAANAGAVVASTRVRPAIECPSGCSGRGLCVQYELAAPRCECSLGYKGRACEASGEPSTCPGDCTGRGRCTDGWCHCEKGAYGADCSLTGAVKEKLFWEAPPSDNELRPRIYVYSLPPWLSVWLEQTTPERNFAMQLHERLLASRYRTADMAKADFFLVPVAPMGFPPQPGQQSHYQAIRAAEWIAKTYPTVWGRRAGADHLFAWGWDFGSCPVGGHPMLRNSIHISHFGLANKKHAHACGCELCAPYDHSKDVVVPDTFELFIKRHAATTAPTPRSHLVFFAGYATSNERKALFQHNFSGHDVRIIHGRVDDIAAELKNATFCISTTGAGFGSRGTLAVVFGCIPVAYVDDVVEPFEHVIDWSSFGVRIPQYKLGSLVDILRAIPPDVVRAKQAALACVAEHYLWSSVHGTLGEEDGTRDAFEVLMYALRKKALGGNLPPIRCGEAIPGAPRAALRQTCRFRRGCGVGARYDLPAGGAACGGGAARPC